MKIKKHHILSAVSVSVLWASCAFGNVQHDKDAVIKVLRERLLPQSERLNSWNCAAKAFSDADIKAEKMWERLSSREEYEARRKEMQKALIEAVGGLDIEKTPLNAKVTEKINRDGYRIEKVIFESRPGVYVTGLLFLPDAAKYKAPYRGIILTCGHSHEGKGLDGYLRGAVLGAKDGFAVLIYDPISQGERDQVPGGLCCSPHNHYGALAALLGQSTLRQRLWDGIRAIDYLYSRSDIVKDGVGCMGNSGGGTMTSFLMAIDTRIVAAAPSCYLSSLRETVMKNGPQDAEQNVFNQLTFGLNHAGLVLLGGNAVRIHATFKDFFPLAGAYSTYAVVSNVALNCALNSKRYGITDVPGPHGWRESTRVSSIQWMRRWLAGDKNAPEINVPDLRKLDVGFNIKKVDCGLKGKKNYVTPKGAVKYLPGFKSIYQYLKEDFEKANSARPKRDEKELAQIAAKRAGIRNLENIGFTVREKPVKAKISCCSKIIRQIYVFDDGNKVPAITFMPKGKINGAVIVVDDRSDRAIHWNRVVENLKKGNAIMVADLAGVGETGALKYRFYGNASPDEGISLLYYMLGKSIIGVRAEEMIVLADFLKKYTGKKVEAIPHGRPCISAAHAFAIRRDLFSKVVALIPPKSWTESIRDSKRVPFANVVNGALLDYDWVDLLLLRQ
jgi:hypothetical protein